MPGIIIDQFIDSQKYNENLIERFYIEIEKMELYTDVGSANKFGI